MLEKITIYYFWYFFSVLGGVIGVSVLTRYISPSDYAKLSLVIALATVIQYVVRDTHGIVLSKYSDQYEKVRQKLTLINTYLLIFSIVIAPIVFYFFIDENFFGVVHSILFWLLFFIVSLFESIFIAFKKRYKYVQHSNIFNWLRFLFALLLYVFYESTYVSLIIGYSIGSIVTIAFDYLTFDSPKNITNKSNKSNKSNKRILNINKVFIGSLLSWGILFFDRFLIEYYLGEEVLGGYFAVFQIGFMPIFLIYYSSMNLLMPYLLKNNIDSKQHAGKVFILIALSALFGYVIMQNLLPLLSNLLGEGYRRYIILLPNFLVYAILYSASNFFLLSFLAKTQDDTYLKYKSINIVGVLIFAIIGINFGSIEIFLDFLISFYILFLVLIYCQLTSIKNENIF